MEGYRERLRTGQIISSAMPIQQQPLNLHVSAAMDMDKKLEKKDPSSSYLPEHEISSNMDGKNNLQSSGGQTIIHASAEQQQSHRPDLNLMDLDEKLQKEDAPYSSENETRTSESDKKNVEDRQITEKDAEIEVPCSAEIEEGNASEEISHNAEATEMRKAANMDGNEGKECGGDTAVESVQLPGDGVPVPIKSKIPASDEGSQVLTKEAEESSVPSQ